MSDGLNHSVFKDTYAAHFQGHLMSRKHLHCNKCKAATLLSTQSLRSHLSILTSTPCQGSVYTHIIVDDVLNCKVRHVVFVNKSVLSTCSTRVTIQRKK